MVVEQCANLPEFSVPLLAFICALGTVENYHFILATNNRFHLQVYMWIAVDSGEEDPEVKQHNSSTVTKYLYY